MRLRHMASTSAWPTEFIDERADFVFSSYGSHDWSAAHIQVFRLDVIAALLPVPGQDCIRTQVVPVLVKV